MPTPGPLAPRARDILAVDTAPHGPAQNDGFRKDPVIVQRLFLQQPERLEAFGRVLCCALLLWRLRARAMRTDVDRTRTPWPGWDKTVPERPTAFMMSTKCAGVIVVQLGPHRPLARPLSAVQHRYLTALDVPATYCTLPAGSQTTAMAAQRLARRPKRLRQWGAADDQRPRGMIRRSQQDLVRAVPGDKGNLRHRLQTLDARGLLVIGRSPGGKAAAVWRTPEGQQWAAPRAGRCA